MIIPWRRNASYTHAKGHIYGNDNKDTRHQMKKLKWHLAASPTMSKA